MLVIIQYIIGMMVTLILGIPTTKIHLIRVITLIITFITQVIIIIIGIKLNAKNATVIYIIRHKYIQC